MLQLTGRRGPGRQSLWAGFGPRAGLCRPLLYTLYMSIPISDVTTAIQGTETRSLCHFDK